ncbi:DUF5677 domain-containing protein (plasmid) [Variovorax sp. 375MFSha3.1]|uniref:DUF5677 domain-containing protein n=1 Tax=unclassified Variovorax TaxID=663243 RepID=UPI003AAB9F86
MTVIKESVRRAVDELPAIALQKLLRRKTKEVGIEISAKIAKSFAAHVMNGSPGKFSWKQGRSSSIRELELVFTNADLKELEATVARMREALPETIAKAASKVSLLYFEGLCEKWVVESANQSEEQEGFRQRLEERWGGGLSFLRMLLTCCRELGRETLMRHRKSRARGHVHRRWVLVRLHTRACQVADEVICLMENGFADGAMARWRTLHELAVTAAVISEGDENLAERYILHDAVDVKRQADDHDATQVPLGFAPVGKRERSQIERQYKRVIDRFGPTFAHPYGWAADALNLKKPTFKDLQKSAGRESMNSYYKLASFNVHAGARSLFFNLGSMADEGVLLAGRSNAGLLEPGVRTAQTLALITSLYLGRDTDLDRLTELNSILHVKDAVAPALLAADTLLRKDELARRTKLEKRRTKRVAVEQADRPSSMA